MHTTPNCDYRQHKNVLVRKVDTDEIYEALSVDDKKNFIKVRDTQNNIKYMHITDFEIVRGVMHNSQSYHAAEYMRFPKIKEYRKMYNFTQAKIAELIDVPTSTYSQYESGYYGLPFDRLLRLADFYGVQPSALLEVNSEVPPVKILTSEATLLQNKEQMDTAPPTDAHKFEFVNNECVPYISNTKVKDLLLLLNPNAKIYLFGVDSIKKIWAGETYLMPNEYIEYRISTIQIEQDYFSDDYFVRINVRK